MSELVLSDIDRLEKVMAAMPKMEFHTNHYFADGMYLRELPRKAGTVIVGKVHKKEHFYIVLEGEVTISGNGKQERVKAPRIFVCPPGTKRAVYAHVDSICMTVHRTNETDMEKIEAELAEPYEYDFYLPGNILKVPEIT